MKRSPKRKKVKEYVGPEGQAFSGYDLRSSARPTPKENPATNQQSDPKEKEKTVPKEYEGLSRDAEDRNAEPDNRHN